MLAEDPELAHVDFAIALEPSDNKLQLGCGGSVHAKLSFRGRTAHSARPWQGENAIQKAAALLSRLNALEPERVRVDELEWVHVTSATLASGGRGRNVIPDLFELNLNRRFGPDRGLDQVQAEVLALVAGAQCVSNAFVRSAAIDSTLRPSICQRSTMCTSLPSRSRPIAGELGA